jgi:membrane protein required for colicin V production
MKDAARWRLRESMPNFSTLNPFDWFLIAVVVYSTVLAFVHGFFREVFSLVGLIAGILLASWNYPVIGDRLARWIPWATAQIVAFLLIAILVMVLCGIAGKLLSSTAKSIGLGFFDRLLGGVFGLARGCLLGVAILMAAAAFLPHQRFIRDSQLSDYFLEGAHAVSFVVPTNLQHHIREGVIALKHGTPDWIKQSK